MSVYRQVALTTDEERELSRQAAQDVEMAYQMFRQGQLDLDQLICGLQGVRDVWATRISHKT